MNTSMRARLGIAFVIIAAASAISSGYTKPVTYNQDSDTVIFKDFYNYSPHAWIIVRAIELLREDGFVQDADVAQKYLLPMLEGVTFNDVWGDADLAGSSILDYYVPDSPDTNYGFGSAAFAYKNPTSSFKQSAFYGYENAAEHAQFRYDYALRIASGHWGSDPRDLMAGWVVDTVFGEDDPIDGDYAAGASAIDGQQRFGRNQTPASALYDLLLNHSRAQVVFPDQTDDALSTLHVPTKEVFDHAPEWLDDHFNDADDIEAYNGYDGHGSAWYANWTLDAGGSGPNCNDGDTCNAAPMLLRFDVGSLAHAFFQLGWSIHLLEDQTTPVHTVNSSLETFEVHNDIESMADAVLINDIQFNGKIVKDNLPALNVAHLLGLFDLAVPSCSDKVVDPAPLFRSRWYAGDLLPQQGEGVAHAYARQTAETTHQFMPYIECINTEDDKNWPSMGFFTAYGLDLGIKSTAGLIHQFIAEAGLGDHTPPSVTLVAAGSSPTNHNVLSFTGAAADSGSFIKSVEYSLDNGATWQAAAPADGTFDSQSENYSFTTSPLADGTYQIRARATDTSNNVTTPADQPLNVTLVDTTPPAIPIVAPQPIPYEHSATLTLNYSANDGAGSGVKSVAATMDGNATVGGHGLASGQAINLLVEMTLGPHQFAVTATDNATNTATQTVAFAVIVSANGIKNDVTQFLNTGAIHNAGLATSLLSKLAAAAQAAAAGQCGVAANIYQSFISELQAQAGKGVDSPAASIMIADAQYLIAHCP